MGLDEGRRWWAAALMYSQVLAEQLFLCWWQWQQPLCTDLETAEEEVTHPGVGDSWWVADLAEGGADRSGLGKEKT